MKKDDFYEEDDGRTIADMSGIERQPTFLPHFHRKRSDFSAPDAPRANDRPWESAAGRAEPRVVAAFLRSFWTWRA